MERYVIVRQNTYVDSLAALFMMSVLLDHQGIETAFVGMATDANKASMEELGLVDDAVRAAREEDLVIAVSFPRYTAFMVDGLRMLHERGVPIVLITDTGLSPAYPYADLVFQCWVNTNAYFPSYASCMSLMSVICRTTAIALKSKAANHIHSLEKSLLSQRIFL